jgi:hypothetical protein
MTIEMEILHREATLTMAQRGWLLALLGTGDALATAAENATCECRVSPCPLKVAARRWRDMWEDAPVRIGDEA